MNRKDVVGFDDPLPSKLRACAPMSYVQIAEALGVSRQCVQQIAEKALRKARRAAIARGFHLEDLF